jgi:hypothetical protein
METKHKSKENFVILAKGPTKELHVMHFSTSREDEEYIEGKADGEYKNYEEYKQNVMAKEIEEVDKFSMVMSFSEKEWNEVVRKIKF